MDQALEISIKPYRPEYQEEMLQVLTDSFHDLGWELDLNGRDKDLANIPVNYQQKKGEFWTLWVNRKIEGTLALQDHGRFYLLRRFYIKDTFRGKGMGKLLLQHLLEYARINKIRVIRLSTKERHSAAYHLFEKLGFQEIEKGDYSLRCDIFMEKKI